MRIYTVAAINTEEDWDINIRSFTEYDKAYEYFTDATVKHGGDVDAIHEVDPKNDTESYLMYDKAVILKGQVI